MRESILTEGTSELCQIVNPPNRSYLNSIGKFFELYIEDEDAFGQMVDYAARGGIILKVLRYI